jgi:hypothetical protein
MIVLPQRLATVLRIESLTLADQFEMAFLEIDVQAYISQGRCVDILLDLYCATEDDVLRRVISDGCAALGRGAFRLGTGSRQRGIA